MASCSSDRRIKVWDTASASELFTLNGHLDAVLTIALLPNGWLASGSSDSTIKVWDLEERKEVRTLHGHTNSVVSLQVLKNGNLVSDCGDDALKVWNPYLTRNNLLWSILGFGKRRGSIKTGLLSNDFMVTCCNTPTFRPLDEK